LEDVTALMVAAHLGTEGVLNLLLRAGADVNQANKVACNDTVMLFCVRTAHSF
jgi:ankyrin repeat protein